MALFVFLAGAARAGIVPPNFRTRAHRLRRLGLRWAGLELQILLLAPLSLLDGARERGFT